MQNQAGCARLQRDAYLWSILHSLGAVIVSTSSVARLAPLKALNCVERAAEASAGHGQIGIFHSSSGAPSQACSTRSPQFPGKGRRARKSIANGWAPLSASQGFTLPFDKAWHGVSNPSLTPKASAIRWRAPPETGPHGRLRRPAADEPSVYPHWRRRC